MALDQRCLALIAPYLRGARVLCLAYPDLVLPAADAERILGISVKETTEYGANHKKKFPLPETVAAFKAAGAEEVDCIDIKVLRGVERVVDLNEPQDWQRQYELVINAGTLEHCFNVGQAWRNAWSALKLGGVIFHVAPLTMINHGFWSMNPTLYWDFADENGGKVLSMTTEVKGELHNFEARARYAAPGNAVINCLMRKEEALPFRNPTQWKYR